jgi:hypothetical protein
MKGQNHYLITDNTRAQVQQKLFRGSVNPMNVLQDENHGLALALPREHCLNTVKGLPLTLFRVDPGKQVVLHTDGDNVTEVGDDKFKPRF